MLPSNLPTSLTQWRRYFDVTFKLLEEVVPTISLGYNKVDLILTNLQAFRTSFLTDHQPTVTPKESWILFEFFKTCAAFISYSSQYNSKKILHYIISHPINGQYNELAELYNSWAVQSSMLLCDSFRDITLLSYAHYLDLISIRDSFNPIIDTFPKQISLALKKKIDNISKLLEFTFQNPKNQDIRIFDHSQIIKGENINEGKPHFSQFFKAKIKPSANNISIVEFQKIPLSDQQILDLKYYLDFYFSFNHPNVVKLKGATNNPPYTIILDNSINRNLSDALHKEDKSSNKLLSPSQKLKISLGIIRGLEYFDAMRFVHKDLNSENILLDDNCTALISCFAINTDQKTENCGWSSPEILSETQPYSSSVDIYSFGIILWELLTGKKPFEELSKTQLQVAEMIIDKNIRPSIPSNATHEITQLILNCLATDPKSRPKASTIRNILEGKNNNYIKFYPEEDINEFIKWANETRSIHESIINKINEANKVKENNLISMLNQMSQIDNTTIINTIHELHSFDKANIPILVDILLKLINQNRAYTVQEESFNLISEILDQDDIATIIDPIKFIDQIIPIVGSQPKYMIQLAKIIAPKIEDTNALVEKFINKNKTYYTTEIIKVIISHKSDKINPKIAVKIFESIPDQLSINFLRFIISLYGPQEVFIPPSCKSIQLISAFLNGLSSYCNDFSNIHKIKDMINIEEISTMSEAALKKDLFTLSNVILLDYKIIKENIQIITKEMALIMFYFIAQYCIKFKYSKSAMIILKICILVPSMRSIMSQSDLDIWEIITDVIIRSEKVQDENLSRALCIVDEIPLCPIAYRRQMIWNAVVNKYIKTKDPVFSKSICSILSRKSDNDLRLLFPTFNQAISSDDNQFCLSALKIMKKADISVISQFLKTPQSSSFWSSLTKQMKKQNGKICKSIGKLVVNMIENIPDFKLDPLFLRSVLELIYNKMTTLDTSIPFIFFLGDAIKIREVVLYLQRESFVQYLQQLIWRYENDPRVPGVVDYFTTSLKQHYSQM